MKDIFERIDLGNLALKNRLVRSATWEGIAAPDGGIDERSYALYDELAAGGVGAIITGFTSVAANDHYFDGMMRLCNDALVPQYARLVETVYAHGTPVLAQLALGAYYRDTSSGNLQVEPDDMTVAEIGEVERWFVDAATRAQKAGFDGIQLHLAHFFFFLSRFVSPAVNHRTDAYGGTTANRARIALEILAGIRTAVPNLHVCAKVNCSDFVPGGLTPVGALELCRLLAGAGIDSIEVSGNGTSVAGVRAGRDEAYFAPFAARLADEVSIPVICVGGLRSRSAMQQVLDGSRIEALSLSRPLLYDPDFPAKLQAGEVEASGCISCNACYHTPGHVCRFRR